MNTSRSTEATPAKPAIKLTGWVHVIGCPHTSKSSGQNDIVLIFSEGDMVSLDITRMDEDKLAALKQFVGDVQGYNFVAKCEIAT